MCVCVSIYIHMHSIVVQILYVYLCVFVCVCVCLCLFYIHASETRYMRIRAPYMARGRGQLTIPGGATVFLYDEVDKDGMATVIYDGQVSKANFLRFSIQGEGVIHFLASLFLH